MSLITSISITKAGFELGTIAVRGSKAYRSLTFCWFITNLLIGKVRRIFEIFKVVKNNMAIFMDETPCSLVGIYYGVFSHLLRLLYQGY
jgi:hypothetical protein